MMRFEVNSGEALFETIPTKNTLALVGAMQTITILTSQL